jgi:sensor histidine kinase regulating citrate/malate metabolism
LHVTRKNKNISDNIDGQAIVSVKYTGAGIDHEIMVRLVRKFISKAQTGRRLGLFYLKALLSELW